MPGKVKLTKDEDLAELIRKSREKVAAMTPQERADMIAAQAASYARSLQPCEHGLVDFEQCDECRSMLSAEQVER